MTNSTEPSRSTKSKSATRDGGGRGLAGYEAAKSETTPRYIESDIIAPIRFIGLDRSSTLKATFWQCSVEETVQVGDPKFVSIALHTGGPHIRRNNDAPNFAGGISMMPFEGARWHFEGPSSFAQLYVPFKLVELVSDSLYGLDVAPEALRMPSAVRDDRLCTAANAIYRTMSLTEPTNLMLDSWALILADVLVRRYSRHAGRAARRPRGRIATRGIACVIDYIEAHIDHDLDLASLAGVAAMSVYHFAHYFSETVGMSPHAYVLSRRVRRARDMLGHGGVSLAQIASACGFSSQAHFTTAFRRDLGVTPGAYRRAVAL